MADVKVIIDGNEYSEEEFRKDLIRMLDAYRDKDAQMGVPECSGVECYVCPLYKNSCCKRRTTNSFKTIELVYEWSLKHPVVTNLDKLKELFGLWISPAIVIGSDDDEDEDEDENPLNFEFLFMKTEDETILTQLEEKDDTFWNWLNEEYKEPKDESEE